jgi:hypothetical protein
MKWWMPIVGTCALATAAATVARLSYSGPSSTNRGSQNIVAASGGKGGTTGGTTTGGEGAEATAREDSTGGTTGVSDATPAETWDQLDQQLQGAVAQRRGMAEMLQASGEDASKKKCILKALESVKGATTQLYTLIPQVAAAKQTTDATSFSSLSAQGAAVARQIGGAYSTAAGCKSKNDDDTQGSIVVVGSNIPTNAGNDPTGTVVLPPDVFVPGDERYISASPEVGPGGATGGTTGTRIADVP